MVSKKSTKKILLFIIYFLFFYFSLLGKTDMVLAKKVAIFDWEWGRISTPREGQKIPCDLSKSMLKRGVL